MIDDRRKGSEVLIEVLRSEGVTHIFGNPGTTELPMIDALAAVSDIHYVLGLQESTVVGMADGYAQATGQPAFLNVHTAAGLGNAIGNLTNAKSANTPLVVTAGQQDYRHIITDPLLAGDLTGIAMAACKWTHEVRTLGELGTVLRRAFHDAATAPSGPVFVSLPMNVMDEIGPAPIPPPSRIERRAVGGGLAELADLLAATPIGRLAIVVGDEVTASGGTEAVVAVAESLGATVHGSPLLGSFAFPPLHPLWAGALPPHAGALRKMLAEYDRVFLIGGRAFMTYPYAPGSPLPETVELLHLAPDAHDLGRTYSVRLGIAGDPRATLEALLPLLREKVTATSAAEVIATRHVLQEKARAAYETAALDRYDRVPMPPIVAAHALLRALPPESIVVDEGPATNTHVRAFHQVTRPDRYFFVRGGGLGWGMPAALGVSLGFGREPVLCIVGDGAAMYSPQALWSAAHEQLPVVFAVVNNREYNILKNYMRGMEGYNATMGKFIGMDIADPPVDYCALARAVGVAATLVERAGDVGDAVRAAWNTGKPHLLELPMAATAQG
jgi:benzoylformate decarboxylase